MRLSLHLLLLGAFIVLLIQAEASSQFFSPHTPFFMSRSTETLNRDIRRIESMMDVSCPPTPLPVLIDNIEQLLQPTLAKIDSLIKIFMQNNNVSSLSVGILYDQKIIWGKGYGFLDPSNSDRGKPDLDTIYRIGSISHVFTDLMLIKLRDQNRLALDDEVQKYWPEFKVKSEWEKSSRGITFWQLARQLSGLPTGSPCSLINSCNISTSQAFENLSEQKVILPTDWDPHSSNGAYAILGRALEKLAGKTWEQYLQDEILDPLGMTNTGFVFTESVKAQMPVPFRKGIPLSQSLAFLSMGWASPAGQMYSSVNDLLNLTKVFIQQYDELQESVFLGSSLRELMAPAFINDDLLTGFASPFEMKFSDHSKYWIYIKGARFPGYSVFWAMIPEIKLGFVAAQTDDGALAYNLPWVELFLAEFQNILIENQPPEISPDNITAFLGNYTAILVLFQVDLQVTLNDDQRTLSMIIGLSGFPGEKQKLKWAQGNYFQLDLLSRTQSTNQACSDSQIGGDGEWVQFHEDQTDPSLIVSVTLPFTDPWTGLVFKRV